MLFEGVQGVPYHRDTAVSRSIAVIPCVFFLKDMIACQTHAWGCVLPTHREILKNTHRNSEKYPHTDRKNEFFGFFFDVFFSKCGIPFETDICKIWRTSYICEHLPYFWCAFWWSFLMRSHQYNALIIEQAMRKTSKLSRHNLNGRFGSD